MSQEGSFLTEYRPTDGTSLRKPDVNPVLSFIGRGMLRLMGFRIYGQVPDAPKFVLAAAPHTSNMDGFIMLFAAWAFRIFPDWMVKAEIVKGPFGWLILKGGGMPIDRSASRNVVDQAVECFNERDQIMLVIAPEGTRRKTNYWRTGFYYIALKANVPIGLGFIDYKHKRVGIHSVFMPTGDIEADLEYMWSVYRQIHARFPENYTEMKLRPHEISKTEGGE
jgi:1-acyl-sn-glycerol-3-phosphate acyltransferase